MSRTFFFHVDYEWENSIIEADDRNDYDTWIMAGAGTISLAVSLEKMLDSVNGGGLSDEIFQWSTPRPPIFIDPVGGPAENTAVLRRVPH